MRWFNHLARALSLAFLASLIAGSAAAQSDSTPAGTPDAAQEPIWLQVDGVEQAVVRTWSDVPQPGTAPSDDEAFRLVNGLIVQFDTEENAAASVDAFRDWMVASMQVNVVDTDLTMTDEEVSDLGEGAMAVTATGTTGETPLTITVVVVQQDDRLYAVGSSVRADQDLLPQVTGIVGAMLDREPGDDVASDDLGRFSGGLWEIFPTQDDAVLEGMSRQGELPIYSAPDSTPAG